MNCIVCNAPVYSRSDALCDKCFADLQKEIIADKTEEGNNEIMRKMRENNNLKGGVLQPKPQRTMFRMLSDFCKGNNHR